MYRVNINDYVKVKLTDHGVNILKKQHKELYERYGIGTPNYDPVVDELGYTSFQMHDLMERFGAYMKICNPLVFETEILITKAQPVNDHSGCVVNVEG